MTTNELPSPLTDSRYWAGLSLPSQRVGKSVLRLPVAMSNDGPYTAGGLVRELTTLRRAASVAARAEKGTSATADERALQGLGSCRGRPPLAIPAVLCSMHA